MDVKGLLDLASAGELKNTGVKNNEKDVVGFINLALIELYKRFPLETDEMLIEMIESQNTYTVPDDFMYIVAAYQELPEDSDKPMAPIPINDDTDPLSVNMVSWNKVQVPAVIEGGYISIIYASSPNLITYNEDQSYLATQVPLPAQLIEAALHYMGYRAHGSITSEMKAEDNTHYQRFEASVARAKSLGLITAESLRSHYKFGSRGFA